MQRKSCLGELWLLPPPSLPKGLPSRGEDAKSDSSIKPSSAKPPAAARGSKPAGRPRDGCRTLGGGDAGSFGIFGGSASA